MGWKLRGTGLRRLEQSGAEVIQDFFSDCGSLGVNAPLIALGERRARGENASGGNGEGSVTGLCSSIGTENSIPEEMDHREIAVGMPVMNEVKFLFASEPSKPLKPRSLYVVFIVEKHVRVE